MKESTRIYLIRHGETAWNEAGRYQGHRDVELSPRGLKQAVLLRERLQKENIKAVYASDLRRARETAIIIAQAHGLTVNELSSLRELNFGLWEGLTYQEIASQYPEEWKEWLADPSNIRVPGGESYLELQERVYRAFLKIVARHPGEKLAIVAHGGTLRVIICQALGLGLEGLWRFRIDNGSITILDCYEGKYILSSLNDVCHLCL
ncbi:phosphoglycerate mutase [Thermanaeromonas toyohensis ToBE]|uniref:Alpha-ribazole phosphatase n=1 Tax=Thermanaeromonas toyohensis ToBE TaxID=698762 RepID=A0A1W1VVH0_9FIRM|nr:alpha-ribazole phosphatase [Thermanaeromonas toyohensis]SMB97359.1 phosphoglycerate mutase [Thermanaeromonas toyohensis ToBE]